MLIDDVLAYHDLPWVARLANFHYPLFYEELTNAVVIDINNVAKYVWEESEQEYWSLWEDFPNLAPPWPVMWFEWNPPRYSRSGNIIIEMPVVSRKLKEGCLIRAVEIANDEEADIFREFFGHSVKNHERFTVQSRPKWIYWISYFMGDPNKIEWIGDQYFAIGSDGLALYDWPIVLRFYEYGIIRDLGIDWSKVVDSLRAAPLLTISFLHCKNVEVQTYHPSPKLQKQRARKGKRPLKPYKILNILPVRRIIEKHSTVAGQKVKYPLRLSIVRGHFKDYTQSDTGLFGRYKGIWWWSAHTRGTQTASGEGKSEPIQRFIVPSDISKIREAIKRLDEIVQRDPRLRRLYSAKNTVQQMKGAG